MSETNGDKLPIHFDQDTTLRPEDVHTVGATADQQIIDQVFPELATAPGEQPDPLRDYLPPIKRANEQ